jgi:hypothetical protein
MTEYLIIKYLAPDIYEVRRIRAEDAGKTARNVITEQFNEVTCVNETILMQDESGKSELIL